MSRVAFPALALTLLAAVPSMAQTTASSSDGQPSHVDASLFVASEQPSVFSDLKIRTTDLLEASLTVENRGGSLTYAPLLYGLTRYRPWASELRLRVSQKDGLTTFGVGSQYNPLSPRSARGASLWVGSGGGQPPASALRVRIGERIQARDGQLETLRGEYAQKSRLPGNATAADLTKITAELETLADRIVAVDGELAPLRQELAALDATEQARVDVRIRDFYRGLLETYVPVVGVAYNATAFSVLGGSEQDSDGDDLNDVERRLKKHSLSLTADSRLSERFQISGLLSTEWDRASAEAGTTFARIHGVALTVGGIVMVLDPDYARSRAYLETLFIPSVVVGGAIEHRRCGNADDPGIACPDRLRHQTVLTPFLDLKVSRTSQFRLGTPIRRLERVGGASGTDIGVTTAITLQLGEPR